MGKLLNDYSSEKRTDYKTLERNALSYMYVGNAIIAVISGVILLGAALVLHRGMLLRGMPHRELAAGMLAGIWAVLVLLLVIIPKIRHRWYRYAINEEEIDILSGVFVRKREVVPIERVQKIESSRGPIERHFGLASVTVITAGGNVDINYLQVREADQIATSLKAKINEILRIGRREQEDE